MKNYLSVMIALGALILGAPVSFAAKLAGSDLLKGSCAEVLQKNAEKIPGGLELSLDGSLMGEKHLRAGRADAALLILLDKNKVPEIAKGEWEAVPIAYQTVIVVVNRLNQLEQIDIPTLAGIYGRQQAVDIQHWSAIKESKLEMPLYAVSTRYDIGVVAPLFRNRVLRDGEYKGNVGFRPSEAEAAEYVSTTTNAIGILAVPPADERVKTLALVAPGTTNAYMPTPSNLYNGDYPLAVPLYFVFPKKNHARVRPLLSGVFGDELADELRSAGFVAVPKNLRTNFVQRLDNAP